MLNHQCCCHNTHILSHIEGCIPYNKVVCSLEYILGFPKSQDMSHRIYSCIVNMHQRCSSSYNLWHPCKCRPKSCQDAICQHGSHELKPRTTRAWVFIVQVVCTHEPVKQSLKLALQTVFVGMIGIRHGGSKESLMLCGVFTRHSPYLSFDSLPRALPV